MTLRSSEAIIVLMRRTYLFHRSRIAQLTGAVIVAVALAGCGSSGGGGSTPGAAAATGTTGNFDPSLVSTSTGTTSTDVTSPTTNLKSGHQKITVTTASNASQALALSSGTTATTTTPVTTTTPAKVKTTPANTTPTKPPPVHTTATRTTTIRSKPIMRTVIHTVYKTAKPTIKYVTKYQTKVQTQTRTQTVTDTVTTPPSVPQGAFMPSAHPALSLTSFIVQGNNVGCVIGGGSVRCDVLNHTWTPPAQPASCTQSWGSAIVLIASASAKLPQFACGGSSALNAHGKSVNNGYDVTVGSITCQVRGFGVNCFGTDKQGFILSKTGYILY